ncbi:MAG: hypothetical protein WCK63_07040 [Betaproteobacteria bacterium]
MTLRYLPIVALSALLVLPGTSFAAPYLGELATELATRRANIERDRASLNADCGVVASTDTMKVATCKQRRDDVAQRMEKYKADFRNLEIIKEAVAGERDFFTSIPQDEVRITLGITILAKRLRWSAEKQARLEKALKDLGVDGLKSISEENVRSGWSAIWENADNAGLARVADATGPRIPTVSQKEGNDCAIAALATASKLPYDDVAARAKDLIRQGEWRHQAVRDDPQEALRKGLNGGEVVLLAESLGRAEVIPSSRFEATLKDGRPVMLNVAIIANKPAFPVGEPTAFGDHQIVLTKTFRYQGKTWFEMADSRYPDNRFFVSPEKLNLILQEKGVAFGQDR